MDHKIAFSLISFDLPVAIFFENSIHNVLHIFQRGISLNIFQTAKIFQLHEVRFIQ